MKTATLEEAKMFRQWRSISYVPFLPAVICSLAAVEFAATHHFLHSAGFLLSGMIYLPVAIIQHRSIKRSVEAAISKQLK